MGLRSSPYNASLMMAWVCDLVKGDPSDVENVYHWTEFIANLPGTSQYNPCHPWGYKWNSSQGTTAASFEIYVDDVRTSGDSEEQCVKASRRMSSICNYLGIQDAARKRRFPSRRPSV